MTIFVFTDEALAEIHEKFLATDFTFEELKNEIQRQCDLFPATARAKPSFFKRGRKAQKDNWFEGDIQAMQSSIKCGGAVRTCWPWVVIHKRMIKGDLKEIARNSFNLILAAKRISEVLTVLED